MRRGDVPLPLRPSTPLPARPLAIANMKTFRLLKPSISNSNRLFNLSSAANHSSVYFSQRDMDRSLSLILMLKNEDEASEEWENGKENPKQEAQNCIYYLYETP